MFDAAVMNEGLGQAASYSRGAGRVGKSPDGLGAYIMPDPQDPNYPYQDPTESSPNPPPMSQYDETRNLPYQQMAGPIDFIEPGDTSGGSATRSAGFTLLFVALSTGIGFAVKGGLGAAAGLLLSAGLANGYRAQKWWDSPEPSEKHEAIVSTIFAIGEVAAGAYVGYKAFQSGGK